MQRGLFSPSPPPPESVVSATTSDYCFRPIATPLRCTSPNEEEEEVPATPESDHEMDIESLDMYGNGDNATQKGVFSVEVEGRMEIEGSMEVEGSMKVEERKEAEGRKEVGGRRIYEGREEVEGRVDVVDEGSGALKGEVSEEEHHRTYSNVSASKNTRKDEERTVTPLPEQHHNICEEVPSSQKSAFSPPQSTSPVLTKTSRTPQMHTQEKRTSVGGSNNSEKEISSAMEVGESSAMEVEASSAMEVEESPGKEVEVPSIRTANTSTSSSVPCGMWWRMKERPLAREAAAEAMPHPKVVHSTAFFGDVNDVPKQAREFAGRVMPILSHEVVHLPPFNPPLRSGGILVLYVV